MVSGQPVTKTHTYVYDNEDIILEVIETVVNNGAPTTETIRYAHGPGVDEPLLIQKYGIAYYYHADGLGSIAALTDFQQNVVESYRYTAFGVTTKTGDIVNNPYRFTGREYDPEIGIYYYRARYYDPGTGRFITKDPIGFAGGVNLYGYVQGNPVNFVDPWGLKIKYNKQPPDTVPPTGKTYDALNCLDQCLGLDELLVTGGAETSGHSKGSSHYEDKACDIAGKKNNKLPDDTTVKNCAKKCGFTHGQYEDYPGDNKDHWHFQIEPNLGVPEL